MDKRDIASRAEQYKREMMRLYGRSTSQPEEVRVPESVPVVNVRPEEDKLPESPYAPENEIITEPETEEPQNEQELLDMRYPEPDLSELETDYGEKASENQPVYSEEGFGSSRGYIKINVRTGDDSEPVAGAAIAVTGLLDGNRFMLASAVTDESGSAGPFEVPVPDVSYSLSPNSKVRPYALYDISVTAPGFFNARSVDVPVFSGTTSVQNFSMVPVPLFMKPSDEIVIYYNQEPDL